MIHMLIYWVAHKFGQRLVRSRLARSLGQRLLRRLSESSLGRAAEPLMEQLRDADEEPHTESRDPEPELEEALPEPFVPEIGESDEAHADLHRATGSGPDSISSSRRHPSSESLPSHTAESEALK